MMNTLKIINFNLKPLSLIDKGFFIWKLFYSAIFIAQIY